MTDGTPADFWDRRYGEPGWAYGTEPNDFLRAEAAGIPPGKVLCLAEGEGRNAVHLAALGHEVEAVAPPSTSAICSVRRRTMRAVSADGYLPDSVQVTIGAAPARVEIVLLSRAQFKEEVTVSGTTVPAAPSPATVEVTPHQVDIRREFERAFHEWHLKKYGSSVGIDYRTPGGTNDVRRLLENNYAGYRDAEGHIAPDFPADIHVVWGGGDYFFYKELNDLGILQPIRMDESILRAAFPKGQELLAGVRLLDLTQSGGRLTPKWIGVCLASLVCRVCKGVHRLGPPPQQHRGVDHHRGGADVMDDGAADGFD
jgi:hypothetical protein